MQKLKKIPGADFSNRNQLGLTPRSKKFRDKKNRLKRSKRVWFLKLDLRLGRMWIMEKIVLIYLHTMYVFIPL